MATATSPSFSAAPSVRSHSPCQPGFASAAKTATANAVSHNGIDQTKNCRNRIICGVILNKIVKNLDRSISRKRQYPSALSQDDNITQLLINGGYGMENHEIFSNF